MTDAPHALGWLAFAIDLVALWVLAAPSLRARWWGMVGMAGVNALFLAQGLLLGVGSLVAVSGVSFGLQVRIVVRWRGGRD